MDETTYGILIFLGLAIIFLGLGVLFFFIRKKFQKKIALQKQVCTSVTNATVIKMERKAVKYSDDYSYSWYSTYEYYVDGVRCEKESSVGNSKMLLEEGQKTELRYNPNNPEEIYVPAEKVESSLRLYTIFSVGFGVSGFLFGVILLFLF